MDEEKYIEYGKIILRKAISHVNKKSTYTHSIYYLVPFYTVNILVQFTYSYRFR